MNIARIIENLLQGNNKQILICLEGAKEGIDLSLLTRLPGEYTDLKKIFADHLTKVGLMKGSEYFHVLGGGRDKAILWGVEDKELYLENVYWFKKLQKEKDTALNWIRSREKELRLQGRDELNLVQKEYISILDRYEMDEIGLEEYSDYLRKNVDITEEEYPNFSSLTRMLSLKKGIDFTKIDQERLELIKELKKVLNREELIDLITQGLNYQIGKLNALEYFSYIERRLNNGIRERFTNLSNYIEYVREEAKIDRNKLFKEIRKLGNVIMDRLFTKENDKRLAKEFYHLLLIKKFIELKIYREDLEYYKEHRSEFHLTEFLHDFEKFCDIGIKRDEVLVKNSLARMRELDIDTAILITGGFHTEGIRELLKEGNISYSVISPRMVEKNNKERYISLLLQNDPLEKVMAFRGTRVDISTSFPTLLKNALTNNPGRVEELRSTIEPIIQEGIEFLHKNEDRPEVKGYYTESPNGTIVDVGYGGTLPKRNIEPEFFIIGELKSGKEIEIKYYKLLILEEVGEVQKVDFFNVFRIGVALTKLQDELTREKVEEAYKIISEEILRYIDEAGEDTPKLEDALEYLTDLAVEYEKEEQDKARIVIAIIAYKYAATLASMIGQEDNAKGLDYCASELQELLPEGIIKLSMAEGDVSEIGIQESEGNDWLTITKDGKTETRYYLSKPVLVDGINGKWKKRYLGSRAKGELDVLLSKLRATGIRELPTDDKHIQYALLSPEIESGETEKPYTMSIVEEHPNGERVLWTKPTPGLSEVERYGQLLEFLVPLNAKPRTRGLPSWREQEFTTTKTTFDYTKGEWAEEQAEVNFSSCDGCLQCVVNCPDASLMVDQDGDFIGVDQDHCSGCRYCEEVCPIQQIKLKDKKNLTPTFVSKVGGDKGERTELAGGLVKELVGILSQNGLLKGQEVTLGDFKAQKAYGDTDILQVELIHSDAKPDTRPLVITFLKEGDEWQRAWLRQKKTVLSYGMGELELRMIKELQKEGYSIIGGVDRIRFTELQGIPNAEWERANNRKHEFIRLGLYLDKTLMEMLDTGLVDVVVTGESSWLRAVDKRAIMQKTGYGLWVISPHNILETQDKILDSVMERIYVDVQKNTPELWFQWVGRAGYSTNLFVRIMQGLRGLDEKVYRGLIQGHRLCPACPQPKIVENVCQMAAKVAKEEGKVVKRLIIVNTGCLTASAMSNIHGTAFSDPAGRILFGNAVAVASGVEAGVKYLRKMEKLNPNEKFEVIVLTGDGGDADIGLQPLLGAVERGHKIRYFVFNNEAYMNTGGQRSGATSIGARTKSTIPGLLAPGKMQTRKVVADYVAQHIDTLVIETNPDEEPHFQRTLELAFKHDGFVYCNLSSTCHTGQGYLGEHARSVSRTRIHTGMSPLVIRTEARTQFEIPTQLVNQELDSSLLNWLSQQRFIREYRDRDGEGLFIGDGTSLADKKVKLTINLRYKAIELLKCFQPVTESMKIEGRFSHLVDSKTGKIKEGMEPIVYINQLDIIIRLLILLKNSGEYGDLYTRKEYQHLIRVMVELRSQQRKFWLEKESILREGIKQKKESEKEKVTMDEAIRQRNNTRLGGDVLNIEWFGFAGWGVQSAAHMTSDILHLLGLYPIDWPSFGPERAGAPVEAYNKASGKPISDRSAIMTSQIAMVFDETHMERKKYKSRIFKTLPKDGIIFINTPLDPKTARRRFGIEGCTIITADLSKIAKEKLGDRRKVSIAALAAFVRALELKGFEIDINKIKELIVSTAKKEAEANLASFDAVYASSHIEITPPREGVVKKYELEEGAELGQASPMDWVVATGNEVVAMGVRQGRFGVYAGYPITPSTGVGEDLSKYSSQGLIDTEVVLTESEYAAMSALVGSANTGVLSFTATDSQGLLLMHEVLPVAAGLGSPIIMYVANRAITRKDLSIYCDHTDAMLQLATGWVQLYAKNNQELYDLMIIAPVLWKYLRAPIMVNGDGFNLSHTRELVTYLTDEQVREFQKEVDEELGKIWKGTMAPGSSPDSYMEGAVAQDRRLSLDIIYPKIMKVFNKYKALTQREYRPIHTYGEKGASIAIVAQGSVVATVERVLEMSKDLGIDIKVIDLKTMVPFPYNDIASEIGESDTVIVLDRSTAPGLYPPLLKEVIAAANGYANVYGEIYGLGGRNPQPEDILEIIKKAILINGPDYKNEDYKMAEELLDIAKQKLAELKGLDSEGSISQQKELAEDISDLLLELAYLHIADMKLDQNPFNSYEEEKAELIRYLEEELIRPILAGRYIQFLRITGHPTVKEGIEDERNKRIRVVELLEKERAGRHIGREERKEDVLKYAATILNFSTDISMRGIALEKIKGTPLFERFQLPQEILPLGGLTNIHPTQSLDTRPVSEVVKPEQRFKKGYTKVVKGYLEKKEQIYIPRLLGINPGTPEYEELKKKSNIKPEEFDQLYIRQSALFLEEGDFNLDNVLAGEETGGSRTEGWAATVIVTEEEVRTPRAFGQTIITKRPKIQPIIERVLVETATDRDDYETIVAAVYHELVETYLRLFIKRLGLEDVYSKDKIHDLTYGLEVKNFGASRVNPYVSRAQIKALEIEGEKHRLPMDPTLRKYYLQNELLKRLVNEKNPTFTMEESILLDELAENGYSGVIKVDGRYRLGGLRKVSGQEFDSVFLEERGERYILTGETKLDPATGLKKVYLGNEVIPTLVEILESLGDKDAITKIKLGGKAALLEKEGYPLYLGILWEGKNGDTILWTKEPPKESGLANKFYTNYIELLNSSARRSPKKRFAEWGYEQYEPATMLDLEEQSSLHRRTSDWAEQMPVINWAKCVNCLHCAFKCPDAAMMVQDRTLIGVDPEHCKGCAICQEECKKQGHEAIMMVNKDELDGLQRGSWLDKKSSWQTGIQGGLANHLYEFFVTQLGDKEQILLDNYVITKAYSGVLPLVGSEVLQLRLLPKNASKGTKPLVYTFIKSPGLSWELVVKPQKNILVIGTGKIEADIAWKAVKNGFEVRVVQRFSPSNQPVYYDVEELERYTRVFKTAGLWADEDVIDLVNACGLFYQKTDVNMRFITNKISYFRKKLGPQIPDYLVTGQLDLISEQLLRASIPITGQPIIAPGEAYISRDYDLDEIMEDIFKNIPHSTAEEYAKHARIKIPKGQLDRRADHICHFAGGHGLCTGCDAGIIANKIVAAAVAVGDKLGKKIRVAFVGATGCLEVATTIDMISYGPKTGSKHKLQISYFHSAFTNLGASISGVIHAWEARKKAREIPEDEELIVVGVGGDGGTHDIGLQALSGAWERGEHVFYIEYNNGAYMNTGIQRSSGTPEGAATTTSPEGKEEEEKDLPELLAAHMRDSVHLVLTSSTHDLADFMAKLEQGIMHAITTGPSYLGICATCVPGHRLSTPAIANKTNQIAAETAAFISYTIKDGVLELAPYTPDVPEWDPVKGDYIFRYRYKDKEERIYGDEYIKRRIEFSRMHRENGGKNMRWLTARPVIDRLWAEGRFRNKRNDLEFINRLQHKIIERLQGYLQRDRITRKTDRILRVILNQWKKHPQYKNIFQTVEDSLELERDLFADIKPVYRAFIGQMRRLIASSSALESVSIDGNLIHLLELIPMAMAGVLIPEDGLVGVAKSLVDTAESILTLKTKLEQLQIDKEKELQKKLEEKPQITQAEEKPQIVTEEQKRNNQMVLAKELVTVAWKSRGGKGAVMANKAFGKLLLYLGGYESDFSFFGPERQGSPIEAFLIASGGEIVEIGTPLSKDFTIVLDEKAWQDIEPDSSGEELPKFLHGQAENGVILVNTNLTPEELRDKYMLYGRWNPLKIYTIDAGRITAEHGGDASKPNMTLLGAALRAFQYFGIQYNKGKLIQDDKGKYIDDKGVSYRYTGLFGKIDEQDLVGVFGPGAVKAFIEAHETILEEENSPKVHEERIRLMAERIMKASPERYPEGIRMDGNEAAAKFYEQTANELPLVFATYPITPTTQVGEIMSGVKAPYLQYMAAESEHSAMSASVAAALSGSVAGFATGSQGLAYAWEAVALADDLRAAGLVLYVGNREINHPLNILYGRSDSDTLRRGWLKFIAANQQEVYDFGFIALLASYLARRPAEIDYAAFFITHTGSNVKLLSGEQVRAITDRVKKIKAEYENLLDSRKAWGYVAHEPTFEERRYQETEAVEIASQRAILDAFEIFSEVTGRKHPYFDTYKIEDAEQVVSIVGVHGRVVKKAIDELREEGIKVGLFWPRVNGPFKGDVIKPKDVTNLLGNARLIQVIEHFADDGETYSPLASQIATALFSQKKVIPLMNWIMALGGRTLDKDKVKELIRLGVILSNLSPVSSSKVKKILEYPEINMAINRLVTIYGDKLSRNYPHYDDNELTREKRNYRQELITQLINRDYIDFLGHKEYADVRRDGKELEVKIKLIKLIESNLEQKRMARNPRELGATFPEVSILLGILSVILLPIAKLNPTVFTAITLIFTTVGVISILLLSFRNIISLYKKWRGKDRKVTKIKSHEETETSIAKREIEGFFSEMPRNQKKIQVNVEYSVQDKTTYSFSGIRIDGRSSTSIKKLFKKLGIVSISFGDTGVYYRREVNEIKKRLLELIETQASANEFDSRAYLKLPYTTTVIYGSKSHTAFTKKPDKLEPYILIIERDDSSSTTRHTDVGIFSGFPLMMINIRSFSRLVEFIKKLNPFKVDYSKTLGKYTRPSDDELLDFFINGLLENKQYFKPEDVAIVSKEAEVNVPEAVEIFKNNPRGLIKTMMKYGNRNPEDLMRWFNESKVSREMFGKLNLRLYTPETHIIRMHNIILAIYSQVQAEKERMPAWLVVYNNLIPDEVKREIEDRIKSLDIVTADRVRMLFAKDYTLTKKIDIASIISAAKDKSLLILDIDSLKDPAILTWVQEINTAYREKGKDADIIPIAAVSIQPGITNKSILKTIQDNRLTSMIPITFGKLQSIKASNNLEKVRGVLGLDEGVKLILVRPQDEEHADFWKDVGASVVTILSKAKDSGIAAIELERRVLHELYNVVSSLGEYSLEEKRYYIKRILLNANYKDESASRIANMVVTEAGFDFSRVKEAETLVESYKTGDEVREAL